MKARYWIAGCLALAVWMPLAAAAEEAFTVRDTDVFAGPSSEYPPIGQLPVNAGVELFGCLSDWSWCDVGFGPNRGWIYAGDIVVPYDNQRVAIIEYGPRIHVPVVAFSLTVYWDEHYRGRPWYGERQQWASRVHIDANHGGPPPAGHERAASVAPAAKQPMPTRAAPAQAATQAERNAQPAETRQAQATRTSKQAQQQQAQATRTSKQAQQQQAQAARTSKQAQQQQAQAPRTSTQAEQQQAQAARTSKQAQPRQQAQQQQTRQAQVAQSPKPEQAQHQAKAQPTERQASTRMAQSEHQAQQPQRAQQAPKPEAAPKAQANEEKPKEEH